MHIYTIYRVRTVTDNFVRLPAPSISLCKDLRSKADFMDLPPKNYVATLPNSLNVWYARQRIVRLVRGQKDAHVHLREPVSSLKPPRAGPQFIPPESRIAHGQPSFLASCCKERERREEGQVLLGDPLNIRIAEFLTICLLPIPMRPRRPHDKFSRETGRAGLSVLKTTYANASRNPSRRQLDAPGARDWNRYKAAYHLSNLEEPEYSVEDALIQSEPTRSQPLRPKNSRSSRSKPNSSRNEVKAAGVIFYTVRPVKALMLLRPINRQPLYGWGDFGGKAMQGESPRDTAIREAHEEANGRLPMEYLRAHVSAHFDYIPGSKYALFSCELPPNFDHTVIESCELHPVEDLRSSELGAEYSRHHQREIRMFSPNQVREFMFLKGKRAGAPIDRVLHRRLSNSAVENILTRLEAM